MTPGYDPDTFDPLEYEAMRRLHPFVPPASMDQSGASFGAGFDPNALPSWKRPLGSQLPSDAFNPQLNASGVTGTGATAQPQTDTGVSGAKGAAVFKQPPPGAPVDRGQYRSNVQPPVQTASSSAGVAPALLPQTPQSPTSTPQTPPTATPAPVMPAPPKSNWAQRLGMAVLSMTRLAPHAQQIIHPKYTEQMEQYGRELQAEQTQAQIAELQGRGAWYAAQANEGKGRFLRVGDGVFDQQSGQWVSKPTDKTNLVAIDPTVARERGLAPLDDGTFRVPASVAAQFVKPGKEAGGMYVTKDVGERLGIQPSDDGMYYLPPQGIGPHVTAVEKPEAPPTATQLDARSQQLLAKVGMGLPNGIPADAMADMRKLQPLIQQSTALTPEEKMELESHLTMKSSAASSGTQATIRLQGFLQGKEYPMLDTANQNAPVMLTPADINAANANQPGRYVPAGPGTTALNKTVLLEDIRGNVDQTKESMKHIPELDTATKAKIALALSPIINSNGLFVPGQVRNAMQNMIAGAAAGSLSPEQQDYLINLTNLVENAMAMRSTLSAGQGSDELRDAIKAVIPGPRTPNLAFAGKQLDKLALTLNRLERGIPKVPLRTDTGAGGNVVDRLVQKYGGR